MRKSIMPFVIATYDVSVDRVARALKLFRRYLVWVQNSVFEGELTKSQLAELEAQARELLQDGDAVIIYEMRTTAYMVRRTIGLDRSDPGTFV